MPLSVKRREAGLAGERQSSELGSRQSRPAPLAAGVIILQSVVIIGQVHLAKGFFNAAGGYEFPLSLGAGAAALLFTGPGAVSLDALVGFEMPATGRVILFVLAMAVWARPYVPSHSTVWFAT